MANEETGKFRKRKVSFTQVSNVAVRDTNLSLGAIGLYSKINSYITLEGFDLYKTFLMRQCKEGQKAFQKNWNELKAAGYLKQFRIRVESGYTYEYDLLDEPNKDTPALVNIGLNGQIIPPKIEPSQKGGGSKKDKIEPSQKVGGSKGTGFEKGVYNNTDLNNINLNNTYSTSTSKKKNERANQFAEIEKMIEDKFSDKL